MNGSPRLGGCCGRLSQGPLPDSLLLDNEEGGKMNFTNFGILCFVNEVCRGSFLFLVFERNACCNPLISKTNVSVCSRPKRRQKTKQIYTCTYILVGYHCLPIASSYSSDYLSSVCSHLFRFGEEFLFGEVVEVLDCRLNQLVEKLKAVLGGVAK